MECTGCAKGSRGGALSAADFKKLQRRYQSLMLGLLAIEQITGAVAPRPALIGGTATAATGDSLQALQEKYAEAIKAQVDAESAATAAKSALTTKDAALKTAVEADSACKQVCAEKETVKKALDVAKEEQSTAADAKKKADKAAKSASDYSSALEVAVGKAGQTLKTLASGVVPTGFNDPTETNRAVMTSETANIIAQATKSIVYSTMVAGFSLDDCISGDDERKILGKERLCAAILGSVVDQLWGLSARTETPVSTAGIDGRPAAPSQSPASPSSSKANTSMFADIVRDNTVKIQQWTPPPSK